MDILKDFKHHQSSSTTIRNCVESLGFPCILTVKRDGFNSEVYDLENESLELCPGTIIKLFAELNLPTARLRIDRVKKPNNAGKDIGKDFLSERSPFEGSEINIPLNFKGNVKRLGNIEIGRKYEGVSKLMENLPSCVQALDTFSSVSHNINAPVTIAKGTKLFPARIVPKTSPPTASTNQLICILENGNEIAIPEKCKTRFVVLADERTHTLKDIVQTFALPQTVQFDPVFPENVVSRDDEEACNLMCMLDGPVSLLSVERMDVYVGCLSRMSEKYIPFILPILHEVEVYTSDKNAQRYLDNLYAPFLPSSMPLRLIELELYMIDTTDLHVHYLKDIDLEIPPITPPPRPRRSSDNTVSALSSDAPPVYRGRPKPYEVTKFPAEIVPSDTPNIPPKSFNSKYDPEASIQKCKELKPLPPEPILSPTVSDKYDSSEANTDSCYEDVSSLNTETNNPPIPPRMTIKPDILETNNTQMKQKIKITSSSGKLSKLQISSTEEMENHSNGIVQPLKRSSGPDLQTSQRTLTEKHIKSLSMREEENELPDYEEIPDTIDIPVHPERKGQIRTPLKKSLSSSGSFPSLETGATVQLIDEEVMAELLLPKLVPKKSTIDKFKNLKSGMFRFVHEEIRKKFKVKKPGNFVESSTNVTSEIKSKTSKLENSSDRQEIKTDMEQIEDEHYDTIKEDTGFDDCSLSTVTEDKKDPKKSIQRIHSNPKSSCDVDDDYIYFQQDTGSSDLTKRPQYIEQQKETDKSKGLRYVSFPETKRNCQTDRNKDFFSLSVEEVVNLFEECGMQALADVCRKELLDGAFFKEFKNESWIEEPFCLKQFHILKVQKILSGWRPDQDQST